MDQIFWITQKVITVPYFGIFDTVLKIFDNATIAGIVILLLGWRFGIPAYRKQKDIDQHKVAQEKIFNSIFLLEQHCKSVNISIDRLTNTFKNVLESKDFDKRKDFMEESLPLETGIFSKLLMYEIPEDLSKIESLISLYFDHEDIQTAQKNVFTAVEEWHRYIVINIFTNGEDSLTKRVYEIPGLSLDNLKEALKVLSILIKKSVEME